MIESLTIGGVAVTGLLFFLKTLHGDIKENIKATERNSTDILLLQQQSNGKIEELTTITQMEIQKLAESINRIVETYEKHSVRYEEHSNKLERRIEHMNNNMKTRDGVTKTMLKQFLKDNPDVEF